jgi:hypothetical protein
MQITKIRNEIEEITTDLTDIIREYYKQLYTNKFDNLDEIYQFMENHKPDITKKKSLMNTAIKKLNISK